jgi:hypothetical protein
MEKTKTMTASERIIAVLNFRPIDRLSIIEWAPYWNQTIGRWEQEGMPEGMNNIEIQRYFGLDASITFWIKPYSQQLPKPACHGAPIISDEAEYDALQEQGILFPENIFYGELLEKWHEASCERKERGDTFLRFSLDGFFWLPRTLFGIEPHLFAFFDHPELMHRMCRDLANFNMKVLDKFCKVAIPDFMTFGEDMSYNHGPMISEEQFDEFMLPYYQMIVPRLKELGVKVIVDSDGDITECAAWFRRAGVEGMLPLERQAGVDVKILREKYPDMVWIGAFDKMVMNHGEAAVRAEFERLMPTARQGGLLISCDHQTPPGVSLEQYRDYIRCFREYATMI